MSTVKMICPLPVGAILQMANATDPNTLYPDTVWQAVNGVFLLASSPAHSLGETGGEESITLTTEQLPSHAHGLNSHTHTYDKANATSGSTTLTAAQSGVPAHTHGLNGHTHTYDKANTPTGSTTLTVNQIPSHTHGFKGYNSGVTNTNAMSIANGGWAWNTKYQKMAGDANSIVEYTGGGKGHTHTIGTTSTNTGGNSDNTANNTAANASSGHTHSVGSTSTDTGQASGNTASAGGGLLIRTCRRTSSSTFGSARHERCRRTCAGGVRKAA